MLLNNHQCKVLVNNPPYLLFLKRCCVNHQREAPAESEKLTNGGWKQSEVDASEYSWYTSKKKSLTTMKKIKKVPSQHDPTNQTHRLQDCCFLFTSTVWSTTSKNGLRPPTKCFLELLLQFSSGGLILPHFFSPPLPLTFFWFAAPISRTIVSSISSSSSTEIRPASGDDQWIFHDGTD